MRKLLIVFCLLIGYSMVFGQNVSFYKENITMKIEGNYFYVAGTYYLKSHGEKVVYLVYPYPETELLGEIDSVFIFDMEEGNEISAIESNRRSTFLRVDFNGKNEKAILISYRQKLLANRAEYVLESTQSWGKPFEKATYQLIVPGTRRISSFSLPPQDSLKSGNETIFMWEKENFMPTCNMIFYIE